MRHIINLNQQWEFTDLDGVKSALDLPHTWNNIDGQDGGNDYRRGTCLYEKQFSKPDFDIEKQRVYLEFNLQQRR